MPSKLQDSISTGSSKADELEIPLAWLHMSPGKDRSKSQRKPMTTRRKNRRDRARRRLAKIGLFVP